MMVLVDTSVWVDHLRTGDAALVTLLQAGRVCCHPMILGELACGNLQNRKQVLGLLGDLSICLEATHDEVLQMIERHTLMGKGIGFVDAHLLASCLLTGETQLWTRDKRLASMAQQLGVSYFVAN
jgi:hypothetical protein